VSDVDEATLTVVWRVRIVGREKHIFDSSCPSTRMYHRGSHCSDFIETILLGPLLEDRIVFHIVSSDICTATIQRAHYCASVATLSVFIALLTATCTCQLHKGNVLLCCHGNYGYANTSQCHVIRTYITSCVISLIHRAGFHCIAL